MKVLLRCFYRAVVFLFVCSCASNRSLTYFKNIQDGGTYSEPIKNVVDPVIQIGDLLGITVNSLSAESNILFNNGVIKNPSLNPTGSASALTMAESPDNTTGAAYVVDKDGNINFPVLGSLHVAGMTKEALIDKLTAEIKKSVKNPIVNVRFMNFRITVIGEVNNPSTFTVPTERINVLEALGLAGDMTVYGRRENVLLIREKEGVRSITRINFTDKSLLSSPYFYLQQNDIVYVEPVKVKALQSSNSNFYLPVISLAVSLLSVLVFALR